MQEGQDGGVTLEVSVANVGVADGSELSGIRGETLDYPLYAYYLGQPTPQAPGITVDTGGPGAAVTYGEDGCRPVDEAASLTATTTASTGLWKGI